MPGEGLRGLASKPARARPGASASGRNDASHKLLAVHHKQRTTLKRRDLLAVLSASVCLHTGQAVALPRGSIDARVAKAFNNAFAAGGDADVRSQNCRP